MYPPLVVATVAPIPMYAVTVLDVPLLMVTTADPGGMVNRTELAVVALA